MSVLMGGEGWEADRIYFQHHGSLPKIHTPKLGTRTDTQLDSRDIGGPLVPAPEPNAFRLTHD